MTTRNWTAAQCALADALAAAYRSSPDSIRSAIAWAANEPQELVAELASIIAECVETNTIPNCIDLGDAMRAGKAIWPEVLASIAMRPREPMPRKPLPRVQLKRRQ